MTDELPRSAPRRPQRRDFTFDCAQHGPQAGVTWTEDDHCPVCEREAIVQREAVAQAERRRHAVLGEHMALKLTERFCNADLASHPCHSEKQRAVVAACQAFVDAFPNDGAGLILIGPPGTGKTTLAAATCRAAIDKWCLTARLVTQRELIRTLRATWRRDALNTEEQVLDDLVSANLLVLDDAGVGYGSDAELTQLLDVVDGRYMRRRPTMVCTNLSAPQLAKALGDRIFDRLRERAKVMVCDWLSHRGGAA